MIYAPISRQHKNYALARSGIVKHTNKRIPKLTWSYYFPDKKDNESFDKHLPEGINDELMWVCYDGGRIIGVFMLAVNQQGEVVHPMLVVHDDFRKVGVGTSLSKLAVLSFKGAYNKPMHIKAKSGNTFNRILINVGFQKIGVDKIPILDMNGEPSSFKEIDILEI